MAQVSSVSCSNLTLQMHRIRSHLWHSKSIDLAVMSPSGALRSNTHVYTTACSSPGANLDIFGAIILALIGQLIGEELWQNLPQDPQHCAMTHE